MGTSPTSKMGRLMSVPELIPDVTANGSYADQLDNRRVVVFRLVDPCRDRSRRHWLGRKRIHQVTGIGFIAQPSGEIGGCKYEGHTVVNFGY
jgi:hypothetical protein